MKGIPIIHKLFEWIRSLIKKEPVEPDKPKLPDNGVYISSTEVRNLLKAAFQTKSSLIDLWDTRYYCPSLDYAKRLIAESRIDQRRYRAGFGDCDKFALGLKWYFVDDAWRDDRGFLAAHCCGFIGGRIPNRHAMFWFIDDTKTVHVVEPQTDEIIDPKTMTIHEIFRIWA